MNNRSRRIARMQKYKPGKTMFLRKGAIAKHIVGDFQSFGELIIVHGYDRGYYIGNFSQPHGMLMVGMRFKKKDCMKITPKEAKKVFLSTYDEATYRMWFGRDAI